MKFLRTAARVAEATVFAVTDPIVIPARKFGMFRKDGVGATAIEYGLITAGISVAIIAGVHACSKRVDGGSNTTSPPAIEQPATPKK